MTTKFVKELYNEDLVYSSVVFGMGFWIDDQGLFISAPEFNIELTQTQYDYMYEVLMEAYANDVAEQKDWDVQTFDNLIDNICNGKSTILSNDVKGIMPVD